MQALSMKLSKNIGLLPASFSIIAWFLGARLV